MTVSGRLGVRRWASAVVLALAVLASGTAAAQLPVPPVYCGALPAADCDLLRSAVEQLAQTSAAAFDLSYGRYAYRGADGSTTLLFALAASGTAQAQDSSLLAALNAPASSLDADLTLELALGEALRARFDLLASGPLRVVRTADALYYRPVTGDDASSWGRCDLTALGPPDITAEQQQQLPITGLDPLALEAALGSAVAQRYVSVTRSDYRDSAWFVVEVNIPGLYADPAFRALWADYAVARGIINPDLDGLAQAAGAALPHTLKVVRWGVDPLTGRLSHLDTWSPLETAALLEAALRGQDVSRWDLTITTLSLDLRPVGAEIAVMPPAESTAPPLARCAALLELLAALRVEAPLP